MQSRTGFSPWVKAGVFWAVFLALHFGYKSLPLEPLKLISPINESIFQHMKAGFFTYLIVCGVEYATRGRRAAGQHRYWFARLAAALLAPWLVFILWYIAPAVYGRLPGVAPEIIYSNIITLIVGLFAATFEGGFEQIEYSYSLKAVILSLCAIAAGLFVIFTYELPWADVFIEPNWREGL